MRLNRGMAYARLDVAKIATALEDLRRTAKEPRPWKRLRRERLRKSIVRRLVDGYTYVDGLLADGVDLFAYGSSKHLLELNHLVLCGTSEETRILVAAHLEDTERMFYAERKGGIGDFIDWYRLHQGASAARLAAGCYARIVSAPQLFIEGNQRTAALIASYVLARSGLPPLVATQANFQAIFRLSAEIKTVEHTSLAGGCRLLLCQYRLARTIKQTADPRFLARRVAAAQPTRNELASS